MKKILYVILHTCTRPERYDGVVNSWAKDVDFLFYADCDNEDKKIVKVSDDSTYSSNEPKHVNVIKYLVEKKYQYEWFFFCDDDTFVNTKNLEQNLDYFDKNKISGSVLKGTWEKDRTLEYCSGGAGYLIDKTLLVKISESIKNCGSGYSDVSLGVCAKETGIEFCDYEKFNSQKPEYYKRDIHTIKDMFTYHYVNSDTMIEMYQVIN
jgi:Fringe-like